MPTKPEKRISGFSPRKEALNKIENGINAFMVQFGLMPTKKLEKRDSSQQYNFEFGYNSVITNSIEVVKFEIRSRDNGIILPIEMRLVKHKFIDPFTDEPILKSEKIKALSQETHLEAADVSPQRKEIPKSFFT